jgi:DNA-directed RNA polymerase subunit RPC12/RpoP
MSSLNKIITCPYCKQPLEKAIKRKTPCPHCGSVIFVRQGELVTEEEAQILDWLKRLEPFGLNKKNFEQEREMLCERFMTKASVNDTVWSFLNSWVGAHKISQETKMAYYEMARLVDIEGKDPRPYISAALRSQLTYFKLQSE